LPGTEILTAALKTTPTMAMTMAMATLASAATPTTMVATQATGEVRYRAL
jgi:hypothetical protein